MANGADKDKPDASFPAYVAWLCCQIATKRWGCGATHRAEYLRSYAGSWGSPVGAQFYWAIGVLDRAEKLRSYRGAGVHL